MWFSTSTKPTASSWLCVWDTDVKIWQSATVVPLLNTCTWLKEAKPRRQTLHQHEHTNGKTMPPTCNYCGKIGHREEECQKRRSESASTSRQLTNYVANANLWWDIERTLWRPPTPQTPPTPKMCGSSTSVPHITWCHTKSGFVTHERWIDLTT